MKKYEDVDSYIADASAEAKTILEELRKIVKSTIPKAEEKIWYGVPFYHYHGEVVGFDRFKKHVSFGYGKGVLEDSDREKLEAKGYKFGKGTMQIKFDQKVPVTVIKKIIKTKVKMNEAKNVSK